METPPTPAQNPLFHTKTRACPKYPVRDWRPRKIYFNLICNWLPPSPLNNYSSILRPLENPSEELRIANISEITNTYNSSICFVNSSSKLLVKVTTMKKSYFRNTIKEKLFLQYSKSFMRFF